MDWTGGRHDRLLAGVYLAGWALAVLGVIWTLINQATAGTGPQVVIGGVLSVTTLAYLLRNRVPEQAGAFAARTNNCERAWHRLALGLELARLGVR